MGTEAVILIVLALLFGFYMAWNIGANDVANAMGTSVGSGALTLTGAVILAAIMEFAGAFLVGPHVSETVRKGIVDLDMLRGMDQGALLLVLGMLAALLAAGVWLQLASYWGWPVSTTHSIVGAIVGFGAVAGGIEAVKWVKVGTIAMSWVVSPALSGVIAFVIFRFILAGIFYKPNPLAAAKKATPYIVFAVLVAMMLVLAFKGLKPFWKYPFWEGVFGFKFKSHLDAVPLTLSLAAAGLIGFVGACVSYRLVRNIEEEPGQTKTSENLYVQRSLSKAIMHLRRIRNTTTGEVRDDADRVLQDTQKLLHDAHASTRTRGVSGYHQVERIFIFLQIISAGFVAFAHGANDVANAIGPLSAIMEVVDTTKEAMFWVVPDIQSHVSVWLLLLGGIGIVIGLATWGWRVIETIGKRITELTPSRGFCAEFAAALTILIASVYSLPISTTHTLVGAVLGVGLARGVGALNLTTVRDIVISWVITLPAGAGLAILFFYGLKAVFV